jgi:hypothetical protein
VRRTLALGLALLVTSAHVGDRNTHFRGAAGPYEVHVVVRHPGVVPGLADITVRVGAADVRSVSVQPVPARQGLEGAPRPDPAKPVAGEPGLFAAQLWFMTTGAYSVHVRVEGDAGAGTAVVPVASLATRTQGFSAPLAALLIGLGLFLAAGLVTIVRAAVRESVLPPGALPDRRRIRRARGAAAATVLLLAVALAGGRAWWASEAAAYRSILYEPLAIRTFVGDDGVGAGPALRIAFVDPAWLAHRVSPIVPDHGKRMHAFLVRVGDMGAFAHFHPAPVHPDTFRALLPPLPAGTYHLYADIVHESGLAETLVDTVRIAAQAAAAAASAGSAADPDDAWWTGAAARPDPAGAPATVRLPDGTTLAWEPPEGPIVADRDLTLRFVAREPDGTPSSLEPYMGMFAHAAVHRLDGAVFVHLHPTGTISTAAQQRLDAATVVIHARHEQATPADDAAAPTGRAEPTPAGGLEAGAGRPEPTLAGGVVELPYAFPMPGEYRVFVQTRRAGVVRTAAFVVEVGAR